MGKRRGVQIFQPFFGYIFLEIFCQTLINLLETNIKRDWGNMRIIQKSEITPNAYQIYTSHSIPVLDHFPFQKQKRITWFPTSRIMKSLRVFHKGLKVLPVASTFKTRLVKNFAAKTNSSVLLLFLSRLTCIICKREFVRIIQKGLHTKDDKRKEREKQKKNCIPTPERKPDKTLPMTVLK